MMALAEEVKKGGRYTKKEQEERKIKVYYLHFEQNKSAVKIAELLNVNRNTINEDIRYWHQQVAGEFKAQDLKAKLTKQIQRMEIQRDRLLDDLEDVEDLGEKIKLERFIAEIDNRLTLLFSKMISLGISKLEPTLNTEDAVSKDKENELEIKDFVRDLILKDEDPYSEDLYSENNLKFDYIKRTKCTVLRATEIIEKMKTDGLSLCVNKTESSDYTLPFATGDFSTIYYLGKFANLREYLTIDEFCSVIEKRETKKEEIEVAEKKKEQEFIAKYGPKSQWSDEILEKFEEY
jgi:hypothetical protein